MNDSIDTIKVIKVDITCHESEYDETLIRISYILTMLEFTGFAKNIIMIFVHKDSSYFGISIIPLGLVCGLNDVKPHWDSRTRLLCFHPRIYKQNSLTS